MTDREEALVKMGERMDEIVNEMDRISKRLMELRGQPPHTRTLLNARYEALDTEFENIERAMHKV